MTEKPIFKDCTCELGVKHEVKSSYVFGEKWHLILEAKKFTSAYVTHHITSKCTGRVYDEMPFSVKLKVGHFFPFLRALSHIAAFGN